jgi:hypothetical protein
MEKRIRHVETRPKQYGAAFGFGFCEKETTLKYNQEIILCVLVLCTQVNIIFVMLL